MSLQLTVKAAETPPKTTQFPIQHAEACLLDLENWVVLRSYDISKSAGSLPPWWFECIS